jgi:NAD(P)-dependent dehydrogenase (short-subunit alcohol dehydrogenase family)
MGGMNRLHAPAYNAPLEELMRLLSQFAMAWLLATSVAYAQVPLPPAPAGTTRKAVLVTGASTGIGRKITERLAADGHLVYAGARKPQDLEALGKIPNVQAIKIDVTSASDIADAVATITTAGRGLYGIVNNAGVAVNGPFQDTTEEDMQYVMNVNAYGPWRITKAFAPLVIAAKGRIVTIGSISGILSGSTLGVYSMSKHAVEAFTDSLALQMQPAGVSVSVIEPGNYDSDIMRTALARAGADVKAGDRSQYKPPDDVAESVAQALFEPTPKRRYMTVATAREGEITIRKAIEELVQLNEGHAYTYDRAALIAMIDEALAKARPKSSTVMP